MSDEASRVGTNSGHGHVWSRPDGVVAKCGGPMVCQDCIRDAKLAQEHGAGVMTLVEMTDPRGAAIAVSIGQNPIMKCWEVQVVVGNLSSKATASRAGDMLVGFMKREFGLGSNQLQ